jgi:hypothetical protein
MGLTIHYTLKTTEQDADKAAMLVYKMRQLALDLLFDEVGPIVDVAGADCDFEARRTELQNGDEKNESLFWLLIQAGGSVDCPWNKSISRRVLPSRIIAFDTYPGPGSESANFGLCLYPAEMEWEYMPEDDERFWDKPRNGRHGFSWDKWDRHGKRRGSYRGLAAYRETRKVPTKLTGWRWGSFCKTQYASEYGIPNFLRCHISVVTLLDRMAKLLGLKVRMDDEGKYGPSTYSDDWQEAYAAGRKPTYRRHKGKYNPAALASEVGDWNAMVAGIAGALGDALGGSGMKLEAPIKSFADFEHLEFKGRNQAHLKPFLEAMKSLSAKSLPSEK